VLPIKEGKTALDQQTIHWRKQSKSEVWAAEIHHFTGWQIYKRRVGTPERSGETWGTRMATDSRKSAIGRLE
jgi:hypothetical protein